MDPTNGPAVWVVRGSYFFFWKNLIKIKYLFHWSVRWSIGDGKTISFCYDNWLGKPIRRVKNSYSKVQTCSLSEDLHSLLLLQRVCMLICRLYSHNKRIICFGAGIQMVHTQLTLYIYNIMTFGGKIRWRHNFIWGLQRTNDS